MKFFLELHAFTFRLKVNKRNYSNIGWGFAQIIQNNEKYKSQNIFWHHGIDARFHDDAGERRGSPL